ncbi:hypothetical protein [Marinobacter halophilus]|uniref:DUF3828 domain-containing protein n=1 Tax=Marinobacter halophilus TaxID=1323740 RepID=A0A2T1KGK6_9GAMM|nr:hypothetical protein [Marinobacter halophilus]PSF09267.1 hypothetical protein C7H08_04085 [Marinobacter halophilus]GGC79355.1 hypothetical protein GCM10011362_29980 [Marinobacter halophilus]
MKILFSIALFSFVVALTACGSSDNGSGQQDIPDDVFSEQSPLAFAQDYVKYVQDDASKEIYGQFLHSDAREKLNSGSKMLDFMYQSAPRENSVITDRDVLSEEAKITESGDKVSIRFYFDEEIDFKTVYPHSPFADEGYVIKSGQINLRKDNDRWGIIGHSLDGE